MATIKDVAKLAGVSISTVSLALNNQPHVRAETKEKVLAAARRLNYQPNGIARDLKLSKTETIGLILPDLAGPFYSELIRGIQDFTTANHYDVVAMSAIGERPKSIRYIQEKRTDGMIIMSQQIDATLIRQAARPDFPIVLLNREVSSNHVTSVMIDNRKAAYEAVQLMIRQGYSEIAYLGGPEDASDNRNRFYGYQASLHEAGRTVEPKWCLQGDFTKEGGYGAAKRLLAEGMLPQAIFAANDEMAIGLIEGLQQGGIGIPEEMAVVGFDDIQLASYIRPTLTTVRQPMYQLGSTAAKLLFRLLDGESNLDAVVLDTHLIERDSCPPKAVTQS
ncbi:LacI family DNA-binding transcriptional regulator [Desmospora activa]|uniref:LacI family transcriptional regulator n=1 Tax=Desmospora activa DSM 45169 TaxID=1121389 RepID=A0A2T4ZCL9_9BACL|nr:LacI family DNA-binding transcriptional regulator [Desmospora activa]PTM59648.1 LacI family transcriptional regulator [Desmospora activa DSM 45169]